MVFNFQALWCVSTGQTHHLERWPVGIVLVCCMLPVVSWWCHLFWLLGFSFCNQWSLNRQSASQFCSLNSSYIKGVRKGPYKTSLKMWCFFVSSLEDYSPVGFDLFWVEKSQHKEDDEICLEPKQLKAILTHSFWCGSKHLHAIYIRWPFSHKTTIKPFQACIRLKHLCFGWS